MNIEIFYFSGTGNSLFIAKELMKNLPTATLTPMVKAFNTNSYTTQADIIGFVFPVHALTIPIMVKRFVKKMRIKNAQYIFAIATRGGTAFPGFSKLDHLLAKKHYCLDARFVINMVLNDSRNTIFSIPSQETFKTMQKAELTRLKNIAQQVLNREKVNEPDTAITIKIADSKLATWLIKGLVLAGMNLADKTGGVNYFYHDENCTKCGICARVCLSGKIKQNNGHPEWQKGVFCYMCYACINYCPAKSVQIHDIPGVKSYSLVNGRYHHPNIGVAEIEAQKI